VAHTLAETNASNAVLLARPECLVAEVDDPGVGKAWRWRISRKNTAERVPKVRGPRQYAPTRRQGGTGCGSLRGQRLRRMFNVVAIFESV
jgi:hypothetical protein